MTTAINTTWKRYFEDPDEGLGTTYERFILHQCFERLYRKYSIQKVLEAPSFGMTGISGINSMWWATRGVDVTVMDDVQERLELTQKVWEETGLAADFFTTSDEYGSLSFMDKSFDLSWNFASLAFVSNMEQFLSELARVTRTIIFICVPNRLSLGYRWQNRGSQGVVSLVSENMKPERILTIMDGLEWRADESGYLDAPPWPDIGMKKEDFLRKLGLRGLADKLENRNHNPTCILDYYKGLKPNMDKEFKKYSFLENLPNWLKRLWAHHRYSIFVPKSG
jgi:hypothetical protein